MQVIDWWWRLYIMQKNGYYEGDIEVGGHWSLYPNW